MVQNLPKRETISVVQEPETFRNAETTAG